VQVDLAAQLIHRHVIQIFILEEGDEFSSFVCFVVVVDWVERLLRNPTIWKSIRKKYEALFPG
jgi:hypothetical protein